MRRSRVLSATVSVCITLGLATTGALSAGAQSAKPKADDVGITAKEIRLAVIADVDTPVQPGLFQKGHLNLAANEAIMRTLMDAFNVMLQQVSALPEFGHVTYVNLRGTLSQGAGYKEDWANELHPTQEGFRAVASRIAENI